MSTPLNDNKTVNPHLTLLFTTGDGIQIPEECAVQIRGDFV